MKTKWVSVYLKLAALGLAALLFTACPAGPGTNDPGSSTGSSTSSSSSSASVSFLWDLNAAGDIVSFDNDGTGSTITFDATMNTNVNNGGTGSVKLGICSSGQESKLKVKLNSKLAQWTGNTKLNLWVYLPLGSDVSNIGVYLFAEPSFVWIDYTQVMGPFPQGVWTNVQMTLLPNQQNAASYATNSQNIWVGLTFFSWVPGTASKKSMNTNVNLNGLGVLP